MLARLLWNRSRLARRSRMSRAEITALQTKALDNLRSFAYARSPFYRRFHAGLFDAPLEALPVLSKSTLMAEWDDLITAPGIRLRDVSSRLLEGKRNEESPRAQGLYRNRYVLTATSGTTGGPGVFLHDPAEWAWILASYTRANDWAGIPAGLHRRLRLAVVSTRTPWHQSARIGASLDGPWVPSLRLDATSPIAEQCEALNRFHPQSLGGYPSVLRQLAAEQSAGRLRIRPDAVFSAAEVLDDDTRARIKAAWGREPFDIYGATETGCLASECRNHRLHLFEDMVVAESVDERNRPVPPGEVGAKLLVSVLFSRTLPLIRYELSDCVAVSPEPCPCGFPFMTLSGIEGRMEEVMRIPRLPTGEGVKVTSKAVAGTGAPGSADTVEIHPNVFHNRLEILPAQGWQVEQTSREGILIRVTGLLPGFDMQPVLAGLDQDISALGGRAALAWEHAAELKRGPNGKLILVSAFKPYDP